ncbi:MAG: polysaccharide deacetylase family protein [Verrucomicrobiota bacterium]|nr:polysaccharide deacetylase family protein [Verrucomicrobiota bacterium]
MTGAATADFLPIAAPALSPAKALVVSIHDVAPATQSASAKILEQLAVAGVRVTSLLVVPDYHHQGKAIEDRAFVSWLKQLEADGHEIVIHGYFHQRPRRATETARDKFITRFYTQDEGEFFDLAYDDALTRIQRAGEEFRSANFNANGFIAPAWLLSDDSERAARDAGMQYTTRLRRVTDLTTHESQTARSLVYSTRTAWRRAASLLWNAALARQLEFSPLVRLSIHPPDLDHARVWHQILQLARRFSGTREVTTYRDWIAEQGKRR